MNEVIRERNGRLRLASDLIQACLENPKRYSPVIRRLAGRAGLQAIKSRRDGLWYFANLDNVVVSVPEGVPDEDISVFGMENREALEFAICANHQRKGGNK